MSIPKVARETRVLIVGTGLTGSLACYHLRAQARERSLPLRIDVADMARGPGGRMSTTRFGPDSIRANTGAQYLSTSSARAAALLQSTCSPSACPLHRVGDPLKRTTHFSRDPDDRYTHWPAPWHQLCGQAVSVRWRARPGRLRVAAATDGGKCDIGAPAAHAALRQRWHHISVRRCHSRHAAKGGLDLLTL